MIIYNVTVKVESTVAVEWLEWMQQIHIPDVMNTGCFVSYRISSLLNDEDSENPTFIIQYNCASIENFKKYELQFATNLRNDVTKKFGERFVAFRTLMEEISNSGN